MPRRISKKRRLSSAGSCSSAAIIGGNDDLLSHVLIILPAKSLVRFKAVCKHWRNLISDKYFARLHIQNHGRRPVETQHSFILSVRGRTQFFICHPDKKKLVPVSLPKPIKLQLQRLEYMRILQSLHGLLLLSLKFFGVDRISYVVFNPTTKLYKFIDLDGYRPLMFILIFDPWKSEYYKLVMKTSTTPPYSVYDSATNQWSHGHDSPFTKDVIGFRIPITVLYNLVVSFLRQGYIKLIQISGPDNLDNYMFDSNQRLNILQLKPFQDENKRFFRVCEMIDSKWVIRKKVVLDFDSSTVELLGMIAEERLEDSTFLFHVPGRLLVYKFSHDKDLEVLIDYRSDYFYQEDELQFEYAHPFIHTFACI